MIGAYRAAVGNAVSGKTYSVTIGNGADAFGYNSSAGSISSTSLKAATIAAIYTDDSLSPLYDFEIEVGSSVAQGYFTYLTVQDSAGTVRKYAAADALNFSGTRWSWGDASNPVWTATTPTPRQVIIYW